MEKPRGGGQGATNKGIFSFAIQIRQLFITSLEGSYFYPRNMLAIWPYVGGKGKKGGKGRMSDSPTKRKGSIEGLAQGWKPPLVVVQEGAT